MKRKFAVRLLCVGVALLFAAGNVVSQEEGVPALYRIDVAKDGSIKVTPLQNSPGGNGEILLPGDEENPPQEQVKEDGLPGLEIGETPDLSVRLLQTESTAAPDESQVAPAQEISQVPVGPDMSPYVGEEPKTPTTTEAADDAQVGKSLEVGTAETGLPLQQATSESDDPFTKGPPVPADRRERLIVSVSLEPQVLGRILTGEQVAFGRTGEYFILDASGLDLLKSRGISYVVVGSDVILKPEPRLGGDEASPPGEKDGPSSVEDAYLYGVNNTDRTIPDLGWNWSGVTLSGAPANARVTRVDYAFRVYHTWPGDLQIYVWNSTHQTLVWNRLGGTTDGGYDDDPESDDDIYMNWRMTSFFNNDYPNRLWTVDCYDRASSDVGYIDWVAFRVWYTVGTPNLTLYQGTGSVNRRDFNSSTNVLGVYFSVGNLGSAPAGPFYTGIYLSPDINITTADRRVGYVYQSGLANGYYINKSMPSVDLDLLSPALAAGTYYVGMIIDVNGQVAESNEGDNRWYFTAPIVYTRPVNLSLYQGTGSVNRRDYNTTTHVLGVYFSIGNFGTGVAGPFYTGVYLSPDINITTADRRVGYVYQSGLAGGYYINKSMPAVDLDLLSPALAAGTYYVGLIIDVNNQVAETNEGDNRWYFTAPVVYTRPVNLSLYQGTGSVNRRDYNTTTQVLNVYFSVGNFGTGAAGLFYTGIYLSPDVNITTGDRRVGYLSQASLAGGYYVNKSMPAVDLDLLSPALVAGTYYVGLIIDVNNQVAETNEGDNRWYFTSPIIFRTNLSLYRGTGAVNNYTYYPSTHVLILRYSLGNFGTGSAGLFYNDVYLSLDQTITTSDRRLSRQSQASLARGYYINRSYTVDLDLLSPALPHATYYVGLWIDASSVVPETNEGDNKWIWIPAIGYSAAGGLAKEGVEEETPTAFSLMQNYPNPFNPSTTIRYALPQKSMVTVIVYSAVGQEVRRLVQSEQEAGYHEVQFDASGLSSGVYFYRLQAGDFVQTRQLLLLK